MSSPENPFVRDEWLDKPGIVGARWWNQSLRDATKLETRRGLLAIAGGIGVLVAVGVLEAQLGSDDQDIQTREEVRTALSLQRDYGWNFGASDESLVYDGITTTPFERSTLTRMVYELGPVRQDLKPYNINTLFQSPEALPAKLLPGEDSQTPHVPIAAALRPMFTAKMDELYKIGRNLSKLLISGSADPVALVIDMDGPNAVAFAAGIAEDFDPVFLFDNWPHPRGVVPAHRTLAAAAYYQPRFVATTAIRSPQWPAFVLDRNRLASYTDDSRQFDNRWFAKLPSASAMAALKVAHILYVVEQVAHLPELDDLNHAFMALNAWNIDVRAIACNAFVARSSPDPTPGSRDYFYGGTEASEAGFFAHYPWKAPPLPPEPGASTAEMKAAAYHPAPRSNKVGLTAIADNNASIELPKIGLVPVVVAVGTGALLGAKLAGRNGSWGRSGGSSGWGS